MIRRTDHLWSITLLSLALILAACGGRKQNANVSSGPPGEVTIYVSTDRVFSEPILNAYEQKTGVKVNAVYDTEETKSTRLANRLLAEKNNTQAHAFCPMRLAARSR